MPNFSSVTYSHNDLLQKFPCVFSGSGALIDTEKNIAAVTKCKKRILIVEFLINKTHIKGMELDQGRKSWILSFNES